MKRFRNIFLLLFAGILLASCASSGSNSFSTFAEIPSYLTKSQRAMIKSLQRIDKEGYLYRLDYTEDYQLEQVVEQASRGNSNDLSLYIRNLMSPNSKFKAPTIGFNSACSAFFAKTSYGDGILASNYDGTNVDSATVIVRTNPVDGYMSVGLTDMTYLGIIRATLYSAKGQDYLLDAPFYTVSGINETGLTVAALTIEHSKETFENTERPNMPSYLVVRALLDRADSIETAVQIVNSFDIMPDADGTVRHFIVSDASGSAAVIEIVNGRVSLVKAKDENAGLSLTNYYLTPGVSEYKDGLWRKRMIDMNLAMTSALTEEGAMDILTSVRYSSDYEKLGLYRELGKNPHDKVNLDKITVWSVVYNTNSKSATIAVRENYNSVYSFGI